MPTYSYACKSCGHHFDIAQSFTDDALTTCPQCDGTLRKVWGSVGVVFKGSGFYRTDSRSSSTGSSGPAKASGAKESGNKDSGSKESGSKTSSSTAAATAAKDGSAA